MSKLGRAVTISVNNVAFGAARTKSLTIANSPVDVSVDSDAGVRKLLDQPGEKTVEISLEGVTKDSGLLALAMNSSDVVIPVTINFGTYSISGDFFLSSYGDSIPYKEAMTFSVSLTSAGTVTLAGS